MWKDIISEERVELLRSPTKENINNELVEQMLLLPDSSPKTTQNILLLFKSVVQDLVSGDDKLLQKYLGK
jgi:hypothetical protein